MSTNHIICDTCSRVFKDARGLSIHKSRCRPDHTTICKYCDFQCCTIYVLNDHYNTCNAYKLSKQKEENMKELDQLKLEYEEKLRIDSKEFNRQLQLKEIEYNERLQQKEAEFEVLLEKERNQRDLITRQTDSHTNMVIQDQRKIHDKFLEIKQESQEKDRIIQEKERMIQDHQKRISILECKNDSLQSTLIDLANKMAESLTSISKRK